MHEEADLRRWLRERGGDKGYVDFTDFYAAATGMYAFARVHARARVYVWVGMYVGNQNGFAPARSHTRTRAPNVQVVGGGVRGDDG